MPCPRCGGEPTPVTYGNVTIPIHACSGATLSLSPEQIAAMVQRITLALREQAKRYKKRDN